MKFIRNNLIILTVIAILVSATVFTFAVDDSDEYIHIPMEEWEFDFHTVVNVITQNFRGCAPYVMSASYKTSHDILLHADWVAIGCMESEHERWKYGTSDWVYVKTPNSAFVQKTFISDCWTSHDPEVDYGILIPKPVNE